jgi:hypothetical protein
VKKATQKFKPFFTKMHTVKNVPNGENSPNLVSSPEAEAHRALFGGSTARCGIRVKNNLDPICGFVLITNSKMSFFNTITCSMVS